jgi:ferric-dicitrate binding protein FerR (iron transport regulator)
MKITDEKINLIVKLLQGDASIDEKQELLAWANENESNKKVYVQFKDIWEAFHTGKSNRFDSHMAWLRFKNELRDKLEGAEKKQQLNILWSLLKVAAIVIFTFGISWLLLSYRHNQKPLAANNRIEVPLGSKTRIILPDGSVVWVNSGSKLNYYSDFNDTSRIVCLEGEAYFDVVKNPEKPFVVRTGSLDIKAWGTSFNVKSYPDEDYVETILVSGSVSVIKPETGKEIAQLKPDQKTIYFKKEATIAFEAKVKKQNNKEATEHIININQNARLVLVETKPENFTAWKDEKLIFNNETFDQIVVKLERWYGVKIHLMDENLKTECFTGKFIHNEPLIQVLEAIKITTPIKYKVKQNDVYITKK